MNLVAASMLILSLWMPLSQNGAQPQSGLVFSVEVEPGADQAEIRLKVENKGQEAISLEFPTSQFYDAVVLDQNGSEVFSFAKGRFYLQAFQTVTVPAGGVKEWKETWNYSSDGIRVPAGPYKIVAAVRAVKMNGKEAGLGTLAAETIVNVPGRQEDGLGGEVKEDAIFTGIHTEGSGGTYTVTGKARPRTGSFYYTVEDGHNQLVPETKVTPGTNYPDWGEFKIEISLSTNKLPSSGTLILNIYEKEGGTITGEPFAIVLEQFRGKE
ncbi:hypothetical protein D1B31_00480 [Neobacillus notoginsengisoli]|uniref:Intracellular proteinase inhibitor BsuPI domain-containing protein n=1 Tax=Neobacillus notoginsengisoli TaxID=1578198 RepID=A0A417YZ78_9BACI|nr:BsuPI-related putative proteinase inhibitor [Neobacillus notoginsengisoli]RHW43187.1 hypothetical protein D1B31_00480 [Neobacillus notoginsengisoli]